MFGGRNLTVTSDRVNRMMKLHQRNILLFMDNVSNHGGASVMTLSNVTVKFLQCVLPHMGTCGNYSDLFPHETKRFLQLTV